MTEESWPYDLIETHAVDGAARFTDQYADAARLQGLLTLWGERIQLVEDAAHTVLTERWLDVAVGQQLDELGELVGEPRLGRTDSTYREAINVRISVNQSGGEPERIIEFLVRIAGADSVLYQEKHPAKIEIFVDGEITFSEASRVRELVPAGVGTIFISETGGEVPFGTKDGEADTPTDVDGFGELGIELLEADDGESIEASTGDLLSGTDQEDPVLPTEGGIMAELFEV